MTKIFSLVIVLSAFIHHKATAQLVISNDTTICAGQMVQLSAAGGTTYTWTPSNTLTNANSANPVATPFQTTKYVVSSPMSNANIVFNGNFSLGDTGFVSSYTYQLPPNNAGQGRYWVGSTPSSFSSGMQNCSGRGGSGNMIIANAAETVNTPVWCQTLPVNPNSTYTLSGYLITLNQTHIPRAKWMVNGTPIGSIGTPFLQCIWTNFTATWNSGNNTVATFCVFDIDTFWNGNDFAMDDFSITGSGTRYDTVTVAVIYPSLVDLGIDTILCNGATLLLDAQNTGSTFAWNDNTMQQTKLVSAARTYAVTVTAPNSCTASSDIVVAVSSLSGVTISADNNQICANGVSRICVNNNGNYVSYAWNTSVLADCISTSLAGNYYVTVTDAIGCKAESNHLAVSVFPSPTVSISVNGDTLSSYNAVSYQWYLNGNLIQGATDSTYVAGQSGDYSVMILDTNGCSATSSSIFIATALNDIISDNSFRLYPNPLGNEAWMIETNGNLANKLELFDRTGRLVYEVLINQPKLTLNLSLLPGFYLVKIVSGEKYYFSKLVKL